MRPAPGALRLTWAARGIEVGEDGTRLVSVPVLGRAVPAGFPSPADDFLEEALDLPRWLAPNPPATFVVRVGGSSMIGAGIHDGDLAVVDRSLVPVHEDVVVAIIDGELSFKRYLRERGRPARLAFENPAFPVFALEEVGEATIWGVVRFSIRFHRPPGRG